MINISSQVMLRSVFTPIHMTTESPLDFHGHLLDDVDNLGAGKEERIGDSIEKLNMPYM